MGAYGTRALRIRPPDDVWTRYVSGSRVVCSGRLADNVAPQEWNTRLQFIELYDFNPLRVRRAHQESADGIALLDRNWQVEMEPTTIPNEDCSLFIEEVRTGLPYLKSLSKPIRRFDALMLSEDNIVVVRWRQLEMELLTF